MSLSKQSFIGDVGGR